MKKVLLLLANGFEMYEASVFIDVIGWNLLEGDQSTKLFTCGITEVVSSSFDQKIIVDYLVDEVDVDDFDAIAIPGGFADFGFYNEAYSDFFTEIIGKFHKKGKIVASICTGALPVAKSGILKNKKGTTYNLNPVRREALKEFGVEVIDEPIVEDENIVTSWNPGTALGVAFLLLEKLTNKENAKKIIELMGIDA